MIAPRQLPRFLARAILSICALHVLAGCQASGALNQRLDEATGLTFTSEPQPVVYARTESRYSRSARDYVYIGPIEVNRQGTREYYLWVGVGTTLDRGYLAPEPRMPETLYLVAQGEPMELGLHPWDAETLGVGHVRAYRTEVRLQGEFAARVTLNQLALLADAPLESILLDDGDGRTRAYFRWRPGEGWSDFVAHAQGVAGVAGTAAIPALRP
jgi:hypothetical protein